MSTLEVLFALAASAAVGCLVAEIIWRGIASLWKDIRR